MRTDALIHLLAQDLPNRPTPTGQRLALWAAAAALAAGLAFLAVAGVRPDLASGAAMQATALKWAFAAVLTVIGGFAAVRLSRPDADAALPLLSLAAAAARVGLVLWRAGGWSGGAPQAATVLRCVISIPLLALAPLAAILLALRLGAVTRAPLAGGFAGLGAAGLAIFAYALNCTEDGAMFLGLWYVTAAALTAMIGAAAGRFVLRW